MSSLNEKSTLVIKYRAHCYLFAAKIVNIMQDRDGRTSYSAFRANWKTRQMKKHFSSSLLLNWGPQLLLDDWEKEEDGEEEKFSRKRRRERWGWEAVEHRVCGVAFIHQVCVAPSGGFPQRMRQLACWEIVCLSTPLFTFAIETKCAGGAIFWGRGNNCGGGGEENVLIHYS